MPETRQPPSATPLPPPQAPPRTGFVVRPPLAERGARSAVVGTDEARSGRVLDAAPPTLDGLFALWRLRTSGPTVWGSGKPAGSPVHDAVLPRALVDALLGPDPDSLAALCNVEGRILAATAAAAPRLNGLQLGELERLPLDAADTAKLHLALNQVLSQPNTAPLTLRLRSTRNGGTRLFRLTAHEAPAPWHRLARIEVVDIGWPGDLGAALEQGFGFDEAATALLGDLATGTNLADIALHRGTTEPEILSQIEGLLRQSGCYTVPELLQLLLAMIEALPGADPAMETGRNGPPRQHKLWGLGIARARPDDSRQVVIEGRTLEWLEYGAPGGKAVLHLHFAYGLTRWSARAIRAARQRGLRLIVPLRAGYGATSCLAPGQPWRAGVIEDYARICDHLGLRDMVVVSQSSDLRLALALAEARPDLVQAILGCAAQLPLSAHSQFERMDKWQRFVLRNAHFAPDVLPSLVKAAYAMLHSFGIEAMLRLLHAGSPPDLAALDTPEMRDAIVAGMSHALCPDPVRGPAIFTAECLDAETDWSALLTAPKVPVRLLQGDCDPLAPLATVVELAADYPALDLRICEGTGQFLLYQRWRDVLDAIEELSRPIS